MSNDVREGCTSYPKCLAARISKNLWALARRGQLSFSTRFVAYSLLAIPCVNSFDTPHVLSSQFYSWYIYPEHERDFGKSISSAEYVDDVNADSIVIIDGLTKVERVFVTHDPLLIELIELAAPWLACVLGHWAKELDHSTFSVRSVCQWESMAFLAENKLGSFLDGGANHPYVHILCISAQALTVS